jgi:hypothetical protein
MEWVNNIHPFWIGMGVGGLVGVSLAFITMGLLLRGGEDE